MPLLTLGLRLARAGGRVRAGLVVCGNALGVALLLLTAGVPEAMGSAQRHLSVEERRLQAIVVIFLALPVLVLLMTVARLSAATRDRRLAALRLLGLSPGGTRRVGAVEGGALAGAGVVVGGGLFLALRPLAERAAHHAASGLTGDLIPPLWLAALVIVGVPLASVVVSLAPTRALTADPTSVRRQGRTRRPSWWRLVPLLAGTALLVRAATWPRTRGYVTDSNSLFATFAAGALVVGVFLPLAVPYLTRLLGDLLATGRAGQSALLAGRRTQLEPAATSRVVAGIVVALYLGAGARCVLTMFESTPQYIRAHRAETVGPQRVDVRAGIPEGHDPQAPPPAPDRAAVAAAESLEQVAGVRAVIPQRAVNIVCSGDDYCGNAFVGTCADLVLLVPGVRGCRDDQIAMLSNTDWAAHRPSPLVVQPAQLYGPDDRRQGGLLTLADPALTLTVPTTDDPNWREPYTLFVPVSTPGILAVTDPMTTWTVVLDGGPSPRGAVVAAATERGLVALDHSEWELEELRTVQGYRTILWTVVGAALLVGFAALLIAAVDRALERRRQVAALAAVGVPLRVLRRSQLIQSLLPLGVGIPLAGGLGLLGGYGYLRYGEGIAASPVPSILATAVGGLVGALLVAALTLPALGRGATPELLRRE